MLMNRVLFFEKFYFENLDIVEENLRNHPNDPDYVRAWQDIAETLNEIRSLKERVSQ